MSGDRSDRPEVSGKELLSLLGGSLGVALLLLIVAVLPAEYGIDPLNTGRLMGITGMSQDVEISALPQATPPRHQVLNFQLEPFESIEVKFELVQGAGLIYHWTANQGLVYELHAEPVGAELGYADSIDRASASSATGTYIAPYDGLHGWFFENRTINPAFVTVETTGFYQCAYEYRGGFKTPVGDCG